MNHEIDLRVQLVHQLVDPLQYILKKAKGTSIKIHAWLNVYYLWSSFNTPAQNNHVLLNHPEWLDTTAPDQMDVDNNNDKNIVQPFSEEDIPF